LLEPLHERVFDIGTTFVIENGKLIKQFMVENFNSSSGGFKGGQALTIVECLKNIFGISINMT